MTTTYIGQVIFFTAFDSAGKLKYTPFNFNYLEYATDANSGAISSTTYNGQVISPAIQWYDPNFPSDVDKNADQGVVFSNFINFNQALAGYGAVFDPWNDNNTDSSYSFTTDNTFYSKPFKVDESLTKYFDTSDETLEIVTKYVDNYGFHLHTNYMYTVNPFNNIDESDLISNQFKMIPYTETDFRKIQDYFFTLTYTDSDGNKQANYYTKYNFNFDLYSADFNTHGSKLAIFTDMVVRSIVIGGTLPGTYGYGLVMPGKPELNPLGLDFRQYFDVSDNENLIKYMFK